MNCHYDKIVITKVKKWKYVFRYRYPAYYSLLKLLILDSQMKTLKLLQKSMNLNTQKKPLPRRNTRRRQTSAPWDAWRACDCEDDACRESLCHRAGTQTASPSGGPSRCESLAGACWQTSGHSPRIQRCNPQSKIRQSINQPTNDFAVLNLQLQHFLSPSKS